MFHRPCFVLLALVGCAAPPAGTFTTESFAAEAVDETFTLTVFEPDGLTADSHVVYLFDGDDWSEDAARIVSDLETEGFAPPLVVGVGYGERPNQRTRDLTPPPDGEVDAFYAFLADELVPWVDAEYDTAAVPEQRTVLGHSFGGAAAVYGLLTATDTFGNAVALSPSLTRSEGVLFALEAELAEAEADVPARAYLAAGSLEAHAMAGLTQAMGETLDGRAYPSLVLDWELIRGRVHFDVFRPAAERGLRFVLEGR
ncbi:MAG: alpha/beta hydrolase [Deltaproteobacteria bacterium]|nr:MAG: alpha/beta hydrolase [Deltaproteobacteria bacterium]